MPDLRLHFLTQKNNYLKNDLDQRILNLIGFNTDISHSKSDLSEFLDQDRQQYNAIKIMESFHNVNSDKLILLTDVDLFIPIFTFIFGLAKLCGQTGIVSIHRLNNIFYGLPEEKELLTKRTIKEIIHELGHLLGLKHCDNYNCVMTSSTVVDELDIKSSSYCNKCKININLY
jgi:archaemetzincin